MLANGNQKKKDGDKGGKWLVGGGVMSRNELSLGNYKIRRKKSGGERFVFGGAIELRDDLFPGKATSLC